MNGYLRSISAQCRGNRGVVLVFALGTVVVFMLLGSAYVSSMGIAYKDTRYEVHRRQAASIAESGIHATIAEIQNALRSDHAPQAAYRHTANVYRQEQDGLADYPQVVDVTVVDEMARINVNHVPAEVFIALGVPEDKAEAIVASRPGRSRGGRYLGAVDDLVTRGLITPRERGELAASGALGDLTVYTVADMDAPRAFINLNTAPASVIAAVFGIDAGEAQRITDARAARPFDSWEAVLRAVSREPHTFNIRPIRVGSREMPEALALSSRCFRLYAETVVSFTGMELGSMRAAVEAIVIFDENNEPHIRYWNERPAGLNGAAPVDLE
jgi:type II secretory pathway component PulK